MSILPIDEADIDLDTNTGTIDLGGGLIITAPALGTEVSLVDPQIVLGATPDASGLFANVNGVRVKVGDIDTDKLDINLARRHGHHQRPRRDRLRRGRSAAQRDPRHAPDPVRDAAAVARPAVPEALRRLPSGTCSTPSSPGSDWTDHPTPTRRACACCTGRTWSTCPTRTSRCSWGRRGRSTSANWPRACWPTAAAATASSSTRCSRRCCVACGFAVTHHQAVVGGEGPTNHMVLLVHLDGAVWIADAGLGEGFMEPLPLREGSVRARAVHLHADPRAGGHVVDGPARVELVQRVPDAGRGVVGGGLRAAPPAAGAGARVLVRSDFGGAVAAR